jgi:hypothetical protein
MPDPAVLHAIRLRGAWTIVDGRHARAFGWPTTLDPHERVWLVCGSVTGPAVVAVNGTSVGEVPAGVHPFAADISTLLRPRNELVITAAPGAPLGDVGLEVRAADSAAG